MMDPKWAKGDASWLSVVPWGLRRLLRWIKERCVLDRYVCGCMGVWGDRRLVVVSPAVVIFLSPPQKPKTHHRVQARLGPAPVTSKRTDHFSPHFSPPRLYIKKTSGHPPSHTHTHTSTHAHTPMPCVWTIITRHRHYSMHLHYIPIYIYIYLSISISISIYILPN